MINCHPTYNIQTFICFWNRSLQLQVKASPFILDRIYFNYMDVFIIRLHDYFHYHNLPKRRLWAGKIGHTTFNSLTWLICMWNICTYICTYSHYSHNHNTAWKTDAVKREMSEWWWDWFPFSQHQSFKLCCDCGSSGSIY